MIEQSLYVCILEEVLFKATNCIIIYMYLEENTFTELALFLAIWEA